MNDQQMTTALELPGFRITQNHGAVRMTAPALLSLCLALISCATSTNEKPASLLEAQGKPPQSSAECLAQNLQPGDPFPASAIPESALSKRQRSIFSRHAKVVIRQHRHDVGQVLLCSRHKLNIRHVGGEG